MRLAVFSVKFLSGMFLPVSPVHSMTIVHDHVPPSTFSGYLFRAILVMHGEHLVRGDYLPTFPGKGLAVRLKLSGDRIVSADWIVKPRGRAGGHLPPYMEYHFRAAAMGAYPGRILGESVKTWTMIKYIENAKEAVAARMKTSIYGLLDAASLCSSRPALYTRDCGKKVQGPRFYEVREIRHIFADDGTGFLLYDDPAVDRAVRRLAAGWYIAKTRAKTLLAVRVADIAEPCSCGAGGAAGLPALDLGDIDGVPSRSTVSFIVSPEALAGRRDDVSAVRAMLHYGRLRRYTMFRGSRSSYLVPSSWLRYLDYTGRGAGRG